MHFVKDYTSFSEEEREIVVFYVDCVGD